MNSSKILVVNCGSSSLKYQLFLMPEGVPVIKGVVERVGEEESDLIYEIPERSQKLEKKIKAKNHKEAFKAAFDTIFDPKDGVLKSADEIQAVGHRVVHGGEYYSTSVIVDNKVIKHIDELSDLAPLHNPVNLEGIKAAMEILPKAKHTATFDTAFHQTIPDYAYLYGLPMDLYKKYKIRRYGFHGTSHNFVANKALEFCKRSKDNTNIISCHLGNGCSVTAIQQGKSIDTSMGFTPLEGLMMGTRSGDIDPAIIQYLHSKGMGVDEIMTMLNKKSGVFGLFGKVDQRDIENAESNGDKTAKLALDAYAYRVKKYIGAYMAILEKVDILIFTGGTGQFGVQMRERICKDLEFIGIHIDVEKNRLLGKNRLGIISRNYSQVTVMVVPTDEEKQMAEDAYGLTSGK